MDKQIKSLLETHPKQAYNLLVETYSERIYWHIRRMVLNHDDANDLVQEVFIKVYRKLNTFRGDAKLYTWLYRIATNESLNFLNASAQRHTDSVQNYSAALVDNLRADTYFDGDEAELIFQKALVTLPEKQRVVFQLKYFEELTYREISEITGTSEGALKANYHHAVKKIETFIHES